MTETDAELSRRKIKEYQDSQNPPVRKVIHEIRHAKTDKEKEILGSDERAVLEAQKTQAILDAFEAEKRLLINEYPQYKDILEENVTSGYELEIWREKMGQMAEEGKLSRKHVGQARMESVRSKGSSIYEAEDEQTLISNLYNSVEELTFLRDMGKPYDAKKLKELNKMRDKLLSSLIEGSKSHGVASAGRWSVWSCLCGKVNVNTDTCPCGFVNRSKTKVSGAVTYVG